MKIANRQLNTLLANDRPRLRRDLAAHLFAVHPKLFDIYPTPYLMALIDDSIDLAQGLGVRDVQAIRVFLQLRWDVAPGFYLQPEIASGLRRYAHLGMGCWERLSQPDWGDAWLAAHEYDQPQHWRERLWEKAVP